jgi:hypothetical protein
MRRAADEIFDVDAAGPSGNTVAMTSRLTL